MADLPEQRGIEATDARKLKAARKSACVRVDADAVTIEKADQLVHAVAEEKPAVEHADVRVAVLDDVSIEVDVHCVSSC